MKSGRSFAAIVLVLAAGSSVRAQERIQFTEYSAKFLCGVMKEESGPVRPGSYDTAINIHNPQLVSTTTFVKKAVFAPREGEDPVRFRYRRDQLRADFAEHVDCKIIRSLLPSPQNALPFVEGFVVVIVIPSKGIPSDIDVVGVYTSAACKGRTQIWKCYRQHSTS